MPPLIPSRMAAASACDCVGETQSAPAESPRPGTATAAGAMTMAQKVGRIKEELSLEPSLPIGRAVAEANETLGIDPVGSIAQQVEVLMSECSLDGHA